MPNVSMDVHLPVTAQQLWDVVGNFGGMPKWHPAVESSELEDGGHKRTLNLMGGGKIVETLEHVADDEWTYTYAIVDSPLPVANYTATMKVHQNEDGTCRFEWSSDFAAAGAPEQSAVETIQGIYQAGFDNLRKMFGG